MKPAWGWSPVGKGSEPQNQAAEGEVTRHRPAGPLRGAAYQTQAGEGATSQSRGFGTLNAAFVQHCHLVSSIF